MNRRRRILDEIIDLVHRRLNESTGSELDDRYIFDTNGVSRFNYFGPSIGMFRGIALGNGWKATLQLVDKLGKPVPGEEADVKSPEARFILGVLHPDTRKKLAEVDPEDYDNAGLNGVVNGRTKPLTGEQVNAYMEDLENIPSYEEMVETAKKEREEERVKKEREAQKEKAGVKEVEKRAPGRPKTKENSPSTGKGTVGRPPLSEEEKEKRRIKKEQEEQAARDAGILRKPGRPKYSEEVRAQKELERNMKTYNRTLSQAGEKETATLYDAPEENVNLPAAVEEDLKMKTAVETTEGLEPVLITQEEFDKLKPEYVLVRYPDRITKRLIKPANDPKRPLDGFKGPPANFTIKTVVKDGSGKVLSVVSTKHATKALGPTERSLIYFTLADLQLYGYGLSFQTAQAFGKEMPKRKSEDSDDVVEISSNTLEKIVYDFINDTHANGKSGSVELKKLERVIKRFQRYMNGIISDHPDYEFGASPFHKANNPSINKNNITGILTILKGYDFSDPRHSDRVGSANRAWSYLFGVFNKYVPNLVK